MLALLKKLGVVLAICLALASCTEKNIYNNCPEHSVRATGEVLAWNCGYGFPYWPTPEPRYTVATGRRATVQFVALNGASITVETDGSSSFETWIDRGTYGVVVEIGHGYPDTFQNVQITKDTTLELNVGRFYDLADSIDFYFMYWNGQDSLGSDAERQHLLQLRVGLRQMIDFGKARREVRSRPGSSIVSVHYRTPLMSGYQSWEAYEQALVVMEWLGGLPDNLYVDLDFYACIGPD